MLASSVGQLCLAQAAAKAWGEQGKQHQPRCHKPNSPRPQRKKAGECSNRSLRKHHENTMNTMKPSQDKLFQSRCMLAAQQTASPLRRWRSRCLQSSLPSVTECLPPPPLPQLPTGAGTAAQHRHAADGIWHLLRESTVGCLVPSLFLAVPSHGRCLCQDTSCSLRLQISLLRGWHEWCWARAWALHFLCASGAYKRGEKSCFFFFPSL